MTAYGVVAKRALTTPVVGDTVDLDDALLDHVPPATAFDKVVNVPIHADVEPSIGPGVEFTVTFLVTKQFAFVA